jgi:hypothetical protein
LGKESDGSSGRKGEQRKDKRRDEHAKSPT